MGDEDGGMSSAEFHFKNPGEPVRPQGPSMIITRDPLAVVFYLLAKDHLPFGKLDAAVAQARALLKQYDGKVSMGNAAFASACATLALIARGETP